MKIAAILFPFGVALPYRWVATYPLSLNNKQFEPVSSTDFKGNVWQQTINMIVKVWSQDQLPKVYVTAQLKAPSSFVSG